MDINQVDILNILNNLKKQGVTQKELAKNIGISQPTISHFVTGRRKPLLETAQKIVAFYEEFLKKKGKSL